MKRHLADRRRPASPSLASGRGRIHHGLLLGAGCLFWGTVASALVQCGDSEAVGPSATTSLGGAIPEGGAGGAGAAGGAGEGGVVGGAAPGGGGAAAACGDGTCDPLEGCASCADDCGACCSPGHPPVFPRAEGFGTCTAAGRGGEVIAVTTLEDNVPGSLRAALTSSGPRIVVFEISGTIVLDPTSDRITVTEPYLTVAGQTAPSPGITVRGGAGLDIRTHDVLVQHLRFRPGDDPTATPAEYQDGFQVTTQSAYGVVFDHVSVSWAKDEDAGVWNAGDVTVSHSIFAEGDDYGLLVGNMSQRVSVVRNLLMSSPERQPRVTLGAQAVIANNLVYNGAASAMQIGESAEAPDFTSTPVPTEPARLSVVGNLFVAGPSTPAPHHPVHMMYRGHPLNDDSEIYILDNQVLADVFAPPVPLEPGVTLWWETPDSPVVASPPVALDGHTIIPSTEVMDDVLAHAGARPSDRDAVDMRLVAEVAAGTGQWVNAPSEVGGWPVLAETARPFTIPADSAGDDDGDGWTNLEELLHSMARDLEGPGG